MSIGERIVELRKRECLSQGDLADAMEVSRQAVSKWENDLTSPDTLNLIKLADILDTDLEYLATGRRTVLRRPPVVIKSVETVEKIVEKPVIEIVEKIIEKPTVKVIEKEVIKEVPVIKRVIKRQYVRNVVEYVVLGVVCVLLGFFVGLLF